MTKVLLNHPSLKNDMGKGRLNFAICLIVHWILWYSYLDDWNSSFQMQYFTQLPTSNEIVCFGDQPSTPPSGGWCCSYFSLNSKVLREDLCSLSLSMHLDDSIAREINIYSFSIYRLFVFLLMRWCLLTFAAEFHIFLACEHFQNRWRNDLLTCWPPYFAHPPRISQDFSGFPKGDPKISKSIDFMRYFRKRSKIYLLFAHFYLHFTYPTVGICISVAQRRPVWVWPTMGVPSIIVNVYC